MAELARTTVATLGRIELGLDKIDLRFDGIDRRFEEMDRRYADLGRRMDGLDHRLDATDRRYEGLERRIDMVAGAQRSDLRWILGVMFAGFSATIAGFATLLGVMAHGFHWL